MSERKKYAPLYEQLRGHKEQKEEIKNRIESLEDSKAKKVLFMMGVDLTVPAAR